MNSGLPLPSLLTCPPLSRMPRAPAEVVPPKPCADVGAAGEDAFLPSILITVLLAKPKTPSSEPKPPTIAVGSNGQEGVFSGGVDIGARVLSGGFLTIPPPDEFAACLFCVLCDQRSAEAVRCGDELGRSCQGARHRRYGACGSSLSCRPRRSCSSQSRQAAAPIGNRRASDCICAASHLPKAHISWPATWKVSTMAGKSRARSETPSAMWRVCQ